jgi:hypothetical protein
VAKEQLMQCPNYSVCQTWVKAANRGNPHKYGVTEWNEATKQDEIVYKDCNGG